MLYNKPFDQTDLMAPYVDADAGNGVGGSIPPAAALEFPQREIVAVIAAAGLTPSNGDLQQLLRAIRSGVLSFYGDTGTADAIAIAPNPSYATVPPGAEFVVFKGGAANATTTPTLAVNGVVMTILRKDGTPVAAGDLPANGILGFRVDGSSHARVTSFVASDILALVTQQIQNSTSISETIQNEIDKSSPRGATQVSAFSANVVVSDIAVAPSFTSVQQTDSFSGASYVVASATCALHDNAGTGSEGSGTARIALNDLTAGTTVYSEYVGGGAENQGVQVSLSIPGFIFRLDSTHHYNMNLVCQKGSGVGQSEIFDTYIFGWHDGTNA